MFSIQNWSLCYFCKPCVVFCPNQFTHLRKKILCMTLKKNALDMDWLPIFGPKKILQYYLDFSKNVLNLKRPIYLTMHASTLWIAEILLLFFISIGPKCFHIDWMTNQNCKDSNLIGLPAQIGPKYCQNSWITRSILLITSIWLGISMVIVVEFYNEAHEFQ